METKIDNTKTIEAVRGRYGSVVQFCEQADVITNHFYIILLGRRGKAGAKRGPVSTTALRVLQRLRDEGLLVEVPVDEAANG